MIIIINTLFLNCHIFHTVIDRNKNQTVNLMDKTIILSSLFGKQTVVPRDAVSAKICLAQIFW